MGLRQRSFAIALRGRGLEALALLVDSKTVEDIRKESVQNVQAYMWRDAKNPNRPDPMPSDGQQIHTTRSCLVKHLKNYLLGKYPSRSEVVFDKRVLEIFTARDKASEILSADVDDKAKVQSAKEIT